MTEVIERPEYAEGQKPTVYNVATWNKLYGEEVEHEELGVGTVERANAMSREVWVRFDDSFRVLHMSNVELVPDVGQVEPEGNLNQ